MKKLKTTESAQLCFFCLVSLCYTRHTPRSMLIYGRGRAGRYRGKKAVIYLLPLVSACVCFKRGAKTASCYFYSLFFLLLSICCLCATTGSKCYEREYVYKTAAVRGVYTYGPIEKGAPDVYTRDDAECTRKASHPPPPPHFSLFSRYVACCSSIFFFCRPAKHRSSLRCRRVVIY